MVQCFPSRPPIRRAFDRQAVMPAGQRRLLCSASIVSNSDRCRQLCLISERPRLLWLHFYVFLGSRAYNHARNSMYVKKLHRAANRSPLRSQWQALDGIVFDRNREAGVRLPEPRNSNALAQTSHFHLRNPSTCFPKATQCQSQAWHLRY